jgi:hypothetical protein
MSKSNIINTSKSLKTHKKTNSNSYSNNNNNNLSNYGGLFNNTRDLNEPINSNISNTMNTYNFSNSNINNINGTLNYSSMASNNINIGINLNSHNYTSSEEFKMFNQKIECVGKIPTARFGHTVVLVSPVKIILFGGAVGDTKSFQFSNETYVLNLITKIWLKLEGNFKFKI